MRWRRSRSAAASPRRPSSALVDPGGRTRSEAGTAYPTAADLDRAAVVSLAGRAAEEVVLGAPSAGAEADLAAATALIAAAHASTGLGLWLVHVAPSEAATGLLARDPTLRATVEGHVRGLYDAALALVRAQRDAVERVAAALVERRLLAGAEIEALVSGTVGGEP